MQDLAEFVQRKPQFPEQEQLKCPRCESTNTKFCYYNNYNLSQPRHYCKSCRRYWTKGGALRNVPVGGGTRRSTTKRSSDSKRQNPKPASNPSTQSPNSNPEPDSTPGSNSNPTAAADDHEVQQGDNRMSMEMPGSFWSLFASNLQFGNLMAGSGVKFGGNMNMGSGQDFGSGRKMGLDLGGNGSADEGTSGNLLQIGDSNCWGDAHSHGNPSNGDGDGWPDLAI
ncbi:hypothetical protein Dimus_027605 [Dionaea muscipula]